MLLDMYKMVYGLLLEWKHAIELPCPQWQDQHGNEVPEDESLGCKVEYKLLYPDRVLTMDETGDNGNQSGDKINRGNKYMSFCPKFLNTHGPGSGNSSHEWTNVLLASIARRSMWEQRLRVLFRKS